MVMKSNDAVVLIGLGDCLTNRGSQRVQEANGTSEEAKNPPASGTSEDAKTLISQFVLIGLGDCLKLSLVPLLLLLLLHLVNIVSRFPNRARSFASLYQEVGEECVRGKRGCAEEGKQASGEKRNGGA